MTYKRNEKALASVVRNKFEFHFPVRYLEEVGLLDQFGDSDIFVMYINETRLNSFYFGSDMILINYLLRALGYSVDEAGLNHMLKRFMEESDELDSKVHAFVENLLAEIFIRLDQDVETLQYRRESVDAIVEREMSLPFFIDTSSMKTK